MAPNLNVRAIACNALHEVLIQQKSLSALSLPETLSPKDKALAQELIYGSCRWYYFLEHIHNKHLKKRLHKNDQIVASLLKVGAYQIIYTRIPVHAAINETVNAAKQLGLSKFAGLINAILRKIEKETLPSQDEAAALSHPLWIKSKLEHNWPDHSANILIQNNERPPMSLRVNQNLTSREDYLKRLSDAEIDARPSEISTQGIILSSPCQVNQLPDFEAGHVSVQDEAAQLCCALLGLESNQRVLDACAAPGGKTCALLEQESSIDLVALDVDAARAKRIHENLQRLGLSADVKVADAEDVSSWWDNKAFDRILLDAPCSATGVIRRHPDIKLLRQENDIKALAEIQLKLLKTLWPTLASGGKLLYATCSIFPQENSRIVERFLKQETTAELVHIKANWGLDTGFGRQLFPQKGSHDGFFYSLLSKKTN